MTINVLHIVPRSKNGNTSCFIERQINLLSKGGVKSRSLLFSGSEMLLKPYKIFMGLKLIRRDLKKNEPDIVHAHWGSILALTAAIACFRNKPLVITFRGSDINPVPSEFWFITFLRILFSHLAIFRAKYVICVSDSLRQQLWWQPKNVKIIPDGTNLALFRPMDKIESRRRLNWSINEKVIFFYEGGRPKVKRRDLAEKSLEQVKRVFDKCRLEVLGSNVQYDQIPVLLNASDCLLMASDYEGSPNIVREALACNLPIVSTDVGDVKKWLCNLKGTKIVPSDPHIIGKALLQVINSGIHPDAELIKHQFSDITSRNAIIQVYKNIIAFGIDKTL